MKAEHRKELETNILADSMGRAISGIKHPHRPNRLNVLLIVAFCVVLLAFVIYSYWTAAARAENSERWRLFDDGAYQALDKLIKEGESKASKAARLQRNWMIFWEEGFKQLGTFERATLRAQILGQLDALGSDYRKFSDECSGDPVFEPEALYFVGVIEETMALQSRDRLDRAQKAFENVVEKHPDSAFGKAAAERVKALKNERTRTELVNFYGELQQVLHIAEQAQPKGSPFAVPAPKAKPEEGSSENKDSK